MIRMSIDIFPNLNLPIVYVCQPYGGMDRAQMEGLLTNYYEYHFLYIGGIHHVESRNVPGMAVMKLIFHPGTNMAQAMAETIGYVNRSRAFMPPVPFRRLSSDSTPEVYRGLPCVLERDGSIGEIQDLACSRSGRCSPGCRAFRRRRLRRESANDGDPSRPRAIAGLSDLA